jgi:hypothetical protein
MDRLPPYAGRIESPIADRRGGVYEIVASDRRYFCDHSANG